MSEPVYKPVTAVNRDRCDRCGEVHLVVDLEFAVRDGVGKLLCKTCWPVESAAA